MNKNCISHWLPRLRKTGVKTPNTLLVMTAVELLRLDDGETPEGFAEFISELKAAGRAVGFPAFLRTGHTSGKHEWKDTCFWSDPEKIASHVYSIMVYSEMTQVWGLPLDVWAVREFLKTDPAFRAFSGRMPITRERRYFIRDGKVEFHHPYWPPDAIRGHADDPDWELKLEALNVETPEEVERLTNLSETVGREFKGYWSLDWLFSEGQWWCTDMAMGDRSFRWDSYEWVA